MRLFIAALSLLLLSGIARADAFDDLRTQYQNLQQRVQTLENAQKPLPPPAPSAPDYTDTTQWLLSFAEEFSGTAIDWTKWHPDFAMGERSLSGNGEREFYVNPGYTGSCGKDLGLNPYKLSNGVLTIVGDKTPAAAAPCLWGMPYVSGMLRSEYSQQYGRFLVRMKLPKGKGLWPAFWLLPVQHVWPPELDPLEAFGAPNSRGEGGPTKFHWGMVGAPGGGAWIETGVDLTADFHVYAIEWTTTQLRYFFDDKMVASVNLPPGSLFNQPFYMITNLAMGGSWPEDPDATTPLPAQLQIDYMRVYQHK